MAGGMDRMARALAAQGMAGSPMGPAPANIDDVSAADAGADLPPLPGEAQAGGPEAALGEIEAALAALSPDAASKGRAHIQALRELIGGEGSEAAPPPDMELPEEAE